MNSHRTGLNGLSRRQFLIGSGVATASALLPGGLALAAPAASPGPILVFSKFYQELKLNFHQAAELTAQAGLDGVDCPVRTGGEVLPERVAEDLPKYVAAMKEVKLSMPLIVTGIVGLKTPYAQSVLSTAKKLGVNYYRLGFQTETSGTSVDQQISRIRAQLSELGAFNRELGITGLCQNHSQAGKPSFGGGDLRQLSQMVNDLDPKTIGVAFDIGHAWAVHGPDWRMWFDRLKPWIRVVYVKDVERGKGWTALGRGEIYQTGFFRLLKEMGYAGPISLHIEYDWAESGSKRTEAQMVKCLRRDLEVLRNWLKE